MLLRAGEKVHIMYRTFFEKVGSRTFLGVVEEVDAGVIRASGNIFTTEAAKTVPVRQPEKVTRFFTLVTGDFVVSPLPDAVLLDKVVYQKTDKGLRIGDGSNWHLDLNTLTLH